MGGPHDWPASPGHAAAGVETGLSSVAARAADAVADALSLSAFTQQRRLLRLHTPLGADALLAEAMDGLEAIGPGHPALPAALRIDLLALSRRADLDVRELQGRAVLLELLTADSLARLRPFHAHVTAVERLGADGGYARWRLRLEPWLAYAAHRSDAWVFQDKTVIEIVDEVLADYARAGPLAAHWRWDLADAAVYPRRSLTVQYHETDLAFLERLLLEEGLFWWFEHQGDAASPTLGRHTLVIADHNGAFQAAAQSQVRFTQAGAVLKEDALQHWSSRRAVHTQSAQWSSWDYRTLDARPVAATAATAATGHGSLDDLPLAATDVPGLYAWPDREGGQRLITRHMQALDVQRALHHAAGTVRTLAPATRFALLDHPTNGGEFTVMAVRHLARSNVQADRAAGLASAVGQRLGELVPAAAGGSAPEAEDAPLYRCELQLLPAELPVRCAALDDAGRPSSDAARLRRAPTVHGTQTAVVVGLAGSGQDDGSGAVHTDRDHRIKVQFHWQRGAQSSHRLQPPTGEDNAPASDGSGTWVRVATPLAGANWGSHFLPRLGQEVVVAFIEGQIDRPVVVGAVYNGQGQADAQGNAVAAGAATATSNAPVWFAGGAAARAASGASAASPSGPGQGSHAAVSSVSTGRASAVPAGAAAGEAHAHTAVLSGIKTQSLEASQAGTGGHSQLVFDDTPGSARIELSTTQAATRLQLGQLRHQDGNQRLDARGHGAELATDAQGALRAGSGQLISAHARPASTAAAHQMDTREPQAVLDGARQLAQSLTQTARQHEAHLPGEAQPDALPAHAAQAGMLGSLKGHQASGGSGAGAVHSAASGDVGPRALPSAGPSAAPAIDGGHGRIPTLSRPDLVLAAPGGIHLATPAHAIWSAGSTLSLTAAQDLTQTTTGNHAVAARAGLAWFTYGQASGGHKPNQETGIALHAASGKVVSQSQSAATHLTAAQRVTVTSTQADIQASAPQHIQLAAGGSALRMEGGNITLITPGPARFQAAMKELAGGGSASESLDLPSAKELFDERFRLTDQQTGDALPHFRYRIEDDAGKVLARGITDAQGLTARVHTGSATAVRLMSDED
ncbi:MAG: type VI secretion system tip protein VgrG [Burkholderiales bacterium]|nr:type VI secretion system tip protein VgrG [Burkholderiales bacterium]